jgi:hypothetical protein
MHPFAKFALVAGGYVLAFLVASAAVGVRIAATSGPVAQASSGMYAFGDSILFVAVFGVLALVPTGAALFFLRSYPRFWKAIAKLGLAVAVTGVAAAILFSVGRHAGHSRPGILAQVSVLGIIIAPLLALAFLVCALFAPERFSRSAFLTAMLMEAAVSVYGGIIWFAPLLFSSLGG